MIANVRIWESQSFIAPCFPFVRLAGVTIREALLLALKSGYSNLGLPLNIGRLGQGAGVRSGQL